MSARAVRFPRFEIPRGPSHQKKLMSDLSILSTHMPLLGASGVTSAFHLELQNLQCSHYGKTVLTLTPRTHPSETNRRLGAAITLTPRTHPSESNRRLGAATMETRKGM